jgi:DNA polymerase-1
MAPKGESPRLALLDGHGIIHRAYHAFREPLVVRKTGEVVTAVYGLANTLLSVLEQVKPTHIIVALDPKGPTFRHERDETYKAQRPAAPEDLQAQFERCIELLEAFNIPIFQVAGFEADDVLGTLAGQAAGQGIETYVVSLDSDMVQLLQPDVKLFMFRPYQRDTVTYDEASARERYGFDPQQMVDFKGLKGDVSDNIPGVPGIGEKTAVRLIQQFGSVEAIYDNLELVEPQKLRETLAAHEEQARHSKEMATIRMDVPITLDLKAAEVRGFERQKVLEMFRELEFRTLMARLPDYGGAAEEEAPPVEAAAPEKTYHCIYDEEELASLARRLSKAESFAFDTETDEISAMRARLVGMSFSDSVAEAFYIPVGHVAELGGRPQLPVDAVLSRLGPILEDASRPKVAHNGKYDMVVLANAGVTVRNLAFDTMVAAYLLGEGGGSEAYRPGGGSLSLKWLASRRLGVEMTEITEILGKRGPKQLSMAQAPINVVADYACADADMTFRLRGLLEKELKEQNLWSLFTDVEMPLVPVLTRMELAGVALDVGALREMSRQLEEQVASLEEQVYDAVGHRFNIGSPQQLSGVLFEEIGLPKPRRTRQQGSYATDANTLETLRGAHPVVEMILHYRQLTKLKSTYVDVLPALINPKTNRIHTTFNQTVTATGRLSSNDPNLQNIPVRSELGGQIRSAFIARDIGPDPHLLAADYSQVELRILAHLCRDPGLVEAFRQDEDIHAATASQVFGVGIDEVTPEMRRRAKVFNFGVLYGLTGFGLSQREGIPREEATQFINTYFEKYARVKDWRDEVVGDARVKGYAETIMGRRRYIPAINSANAQVRGAAERIAINMPVQGTASDIIKVAMDRLDGELEERRMKSKMLLQVHDELIFEGPASEMDDLREMVLRIMPAGLELDVPLKVDVKVGKNWGEV